MYLLEAAWSVAIVAFLFWVVRDPDAAAKFALLVVERVVTFGRAVASGVSEQFGQVEGVKAGLFQ